MSFFMSSPEVTSARMYAGAGSGPMLAAAAAWSGLAEELGSAADSFSSLISDLVTSSWQGAAATAMTTIAASYGEWLGKAATQAGGASTGAQAVASVYESARAAVVHPVAIALNRDRLVSLALTNIFGLNAPAIAATDGEYEEMWATDIAAMVGYHGSASAIAEQLAPWQSTLTGLSGQVTAAAGIGSPPSPPAPAATAVEYGLIAALLSSRLASGLRTVASVDTPLAVAFRQLTDAAAGLGARTVLITQAAAQLSAVAANPQLTQAASRLSAIAVNPAILSQAAAQLSAVAAAPTVLAAVVADPALVTQAASRLSATVANPAALASIVDSRLLTQAAGQLSAVAANPGLLTQAASELSAIAANPGVLTQAAAQLSAVAASPALLVRVGDPILLTQAAAQLSAVATNPGLLTQVAIDLSAIAANPGVLSQVAGDLSAIAVNPALLTQTLDQLGGAISSTPIAVDPSVVAQPTAVSPVATTPVVAQPVLQA
ncbi:PPE family protein [Mycobacterium sp. 23]|uniref:PPE family protein n=1 Tax=Mycobacterium sp. 23 TaxID=3400424 RepID=UPI003AAFBBD1